MHRKALIYCELLYVHYIYNVILARAQKTREMIGMDTVRARLRKFWPLICLHLAYVLILCGKLRLIVESINTKHEISLQSNFHATTCVLQCAVYSQMYHKKQD